MPLHGLLSLLVLLTDAHFGFLADKLAKHTSTFPRHRSEGSHAAIPKSPQRLLANVGTYILEASILMEKT
jgi:hypothetical protein